MQKADDRDTIIKEIQRIARKKKVNQLSSREFLAETGISQNRIYQMFDGWSEACKSAGLDSCDKKVRLDDDVLFEEMRHVFLNYGVCNRTKFDKLSKYSVTTYKKHFGKWQEVLRAFHQWLENRKIEFPFIDELPPLDSDGKDITTNREHEEQKISGGQTWQSIGGTTYGPYLNFRGL